MRHRENIHAIYILLFLNVAFYLFQVQDPQKYQILFAFDGPRVMAGEVWRLFTYQFVQQGLLSLFFNLLILYIMGSAVEEMYGTLNFLVIVLLSTIGSAAVAFYLGAALLGSFFASFSLLFVFATMVPEQVFYLFFVLPVKVKWLAWIALGWLLFQVAGRNPMAIAALGGSAASWAWFYLRLHRTGPLIRRARPPLAPPERPPASHDASAERNLQRFAAIREALASGDREKIEALVARIQPDVKPGVNICPPADYKPEHEDRYCVRCEGFAECSIRYLRIKAEEKS